MRIVYQAKLLRQSRYGSHTGWQEWSDVPYFYFLQRKTNRRIVIRTIGATWYVYPKKNANASRIIDQSQAEISG